jgi:hypothetical protein
VPESASAFIRPEARVADLVARRSLSSSDGHAADERVGDDEGVRRARRHDRLQQLAAGERSVARPVAAVTGYRAMEAVATAGGSPRDV